MKSLSPQIDGCGAEAPPQRGESTPITADEAASLLNGLFGGQESEPQPPLPPPIPELSEVPPCAGIIPPPLPQPKLVGRYELSDRIAKGGQGEVYRARDLKLNRTVALKLMHLGRWASDSDRARFRTEAQAAANLQHPNIVAVHELGEDEDALFIVMDYLEGGNLQALVQRRLEERCPVEPVEAAGLVKLLAEAIHYAHQRRVIHRDLKPSNVLIDAQGQPRIADFGLAKHLDQDQGHTLTGEVLGSPNFMAPEQAKGLRGQIGPCTDVYGIGGILYYLLTRRAPFEAHTRDEVLRRVVNEDPVRPRQLNPSIPSDLQTICLKCLDKEPKRRFQTAQQLADDLGRFLRKEPIRARPAHLGIRLWRWCQRRPAVAALLAGLIVVSAGAVLATVVAIAVMAVNLEQAEQNTKEQKRLREIAEHTLSELESQNGSSYHTAGVFRFKVPPGFVSVSGGRSGALRQAMLKDLTIAESETIVAENPTNFLLGAVEGAATASGKPGLPAPASLSEFRDLSQRTDLSAFRDVSLYRTRDGRCLITFMTVSQPTLASAEGSENEFRERFESGLRKSFPGAKGRVAKLDIDGQPAIMSEFIDPVGGARNRSYAVSIRGQSGQLHIFGVTQNSPPYDDAIDKDLLNSIQIVVPK